VLAICLTEGEKKTLAADRIGAALLEKAERLATSDNVLRS
jgi:hypothetical protein